MTFMIITIKFNQNHRFKTQFQINMRIIKNLYYLQNRLMIIRLKLRHLIQMEKKNLWMQMNLLIPKNLYLMRKKILQIQVLYLTILKKKLLS
jgi:hypothetical protein